jgi:hypothetical protein
MAIPTVYATINFSTGPAFAQAMIIGTGVFGTNVFADATAVIVDVSDQVNYIKTQRGRNSLSDQFQTGTLSMRIIDQNGDFNPLNVSGPYYSFLTPMKKVQITASYNGTSYFLFSGFITSYVNTQPKDAQEVAYTTITAVDAFRLANLAQITNVAGATSGDLSGTRINQILDEIDWPTTMRDVDTGLTYLQNDPGVIRTSLAAMQTVTDSEYGALYVAADGNFTFQDRTVTASSIAGTPTVFKDDGTAISYANAAWLLNDALIFNSASVSKSGGTAQTASNAASIVKYFLHSYYLNDLLMLTDAEALDYARAYVASRAETTIRCDYLELDLYTPNYNAGIVAAMELDFFDPISVSTTQPGGSVITKTLQIFGVSYVIAPGVFKTVFTTLEPIIDSFIIGTDYGIFDQNVLSY